MVVKKRSDHDEYKLVEEEYGPDIKPEHFAPEAEEEKGIGSTKYNMPHFNLPFKINKKIIIIVVIIVALFIVYQFLVPKKSNSLDTQPTQAQPTVPVAAQPIVSTDNTTKKITANSEQITMLQSQISKMQDLLAGMTASMNFLNLKIQRLVDDVNKLKAQDSAHSKGKTIKPKITYHVRAIVPGRAWLTSSRGLSVSVRPGTKLGEYGKVTVINWQQGIVQTSSGISISYGSNDI